MSETAGGMTPQGAQLLQELEKAKEAGDVVKLKQVLTFAKNSLPDVNKSWIEGAFKEVEALEKSQAQKQGGEVKQVSEEPTGSPDATSSLVEKKALELKELGNAELKKSTKSGNKKAIEFYSEACDALTAEIRIKCRKYQDSTDPNAVPVDPLAPDAPPELKASLQPHFQLLNALYGNRAQAHLNLQNYTQTVTDCRRCLSIDNTVMKNYFRGARASFANGLYQQSLEFIQGGLIVDSQHAELLKLKEVVIAKYSQQKLAKEGNLSMNTAEILDAQKELQRVYTQNQQLDLQLARRKTRRRTQELTQAYIKANFGDQLDSGDESYVKVESEENLNTSKSDSLKAGPTKGSLYMPVGRAFLQRPVKTVNQDLERLMKESDAEIPKMEKVKSELQVRLDKAEKDFAKMTEEIRGSK